MADTSKSPATAKADDSHDGRYTHSSFVSPGGPGGPKTEPTPYPKWVTPKGGTPVIVRDPSEEAAVLKQKGFSRIGATLVMGLLALVLVAVPQAVTVLSTTTLSAAVALPAQGNPVQTVRLASVANVHLNDDLFVNTELMRVVVAPVTGQPVSVIRGWAGTTPGSHASGATVTIGVGDAFHVGGPPAGACVASAQIYSPWIDVTTGNFWVCRTTNVWNGTNIRPLTYNSTQNGVQ